MHAPYDSQTTNRQIRIAGLADDARQNQAIERARAMLVLRDRVSGIATTARAQKTPGTRRNRAATPRRTPRRAFARGRWPAEIRAEDLALNG